MTNPMAWLVVSYLAAGIIVMLGRSLGRWVFVIAALPLVASLVGLISTAAGVLDGEVRVSRASWVPGLRLAFSFRLDGFGFVMAFLVTGIGAVVLLYARGYFAAEGTSGRVVRFVGYFTLFAGAMLGLVLAGDVWTLYLFWELTSVLSFLLIGLDDEVRGARAGRAAGVARHRRRWVGDARRPDLHRQRRGDG